MTSTSIPRREPREQVGNYLLGSEIGRGSFATVLRGYKASTRETIAIKVVQRNKMTSKLLENLEAEIAILKAIDHPNIVGLEDCIKQEDKIYLIMDYCSGGDLSFYIKKRGRLSSLDYIPEGGTKPQYWPHPEEGGLDEVVVRCFLGQLALALKFLRSQNLIHRDIKPQNLLLQPATAAEVAAGHPLGIPVLKVADFGFARFLEGASMAETLCGSPLYMAPEILRYEKYDAKADLWSVGTVLYEMSVGRPPFKAQNHVELLKKIERGEDRIRFPDEKSGWATPTTEGGVKALPVSRGLKELIRGLLKRNPVQRMGFEEFFRNDVVRSETEKMGREPELHPIPKPPPSMQPTSSTPPTDSSMVKLLPSRPAPPPNPPETRSSSSDHRLPAPTPTRPAPPPPPFALPLPASPTLGHASPRTSNIASSSPSSAGTVRPSYHPPPISPTLPQPSRFNSSNQSPAPSSPVSPRGQMIRRQSFEPKYIVGGTVESDGSEHGRYESGVGPVEIARTSGLRRPSMMKRHSSGSGSGGVGFGDEDDDPGKDYVVVEKRTVEINALADELDAAARGPATVNRRRSSRSLLSRPISALTTTSGQSPPLGGNSFSPSSNSFALSITPPFALASSPNRPSPLHHQHSSSLTRPLSIPQIPQSVTSSPVPQQSSVSSGNSLIPSSQRYSSSPGTVGALARALSAASGRLFGTSPSSPGGGAGVVARATARRKALIRSGDVDAAEEALILLLEDLSQKAIVVIELADSKVGQILHQGGGSALATSDNSPGSSSGFQLYLSGLAQKETKRRSSSNANSNSGSDSSIMRTDVVAAEAVSLYIAALALLQRGVIAAKSFLESQNGTYDASASGDLNEAVQWFRARFNECFDKAEIAKSRCGDGEYNVFTDKILYDRAMEISRAAAINEALGDDLVPIEHAYETAILMWRTVLDDTIREGRPIEEDDKATIDKFVFAAMKRLESLHRRMAAAAQVTNATLSSSPTPST